MKIYVDIDGVLLTKNQKLPIDVLEFIEFIISKYDCYWLTTHCRGGENKTIEYLKNFFSDKEIIQFHKFKETNWNDLKTEAIDFKSKFIWLEDYPFESEKKVLAINQKEENLIEVNLKRERELKRVINQILLLEKKWK